MSGMSLVGVGLVWWRWGGGKRRGEIRNSDLFIWVSPSVWTLNAYGFVALD